MRLNEWQQRMEAYLLGDQPRPDATLSASLLSSAALNVEQGLAIYHNAYRARLRETLRGDYPTLHHWLGDEEFDRLADAYLRAHPSEHYSLRWLGARFADFIDAQLVAEQAAPLAELARLDWAFTLAFDASAGESLDLPSMAALPPQDWPDLRVALLPSVQWLEFRFNSLALWQAVKAQTDFPSSVVLASVETCLVWRRGLVSHYRSLDQEEARALQRMGRDGCSFAELCAALGEAAPLQAATWLKQWISEGLLQRRSR